MKHFLKTAVAAACIVCTIPQLWAEDGNILVSTPNTSMLLHASKGGDFRFAYFGDRINNNQINQIHESWVGLNRQAYPIFGTGSVIDLPALQVVHADGNWTSDLAVDQVETQKTEDATISIITMKDKAYPFTVKLYYKAYDKVDIIETWSVLSHTEKKPVVLKRFDSGHFLIRRGDVWMSHLHGSWAAETFVTQEPLTPGVQIIRNTDGSRNAQNDHPEVMFSLDGQPQENSGRVIGAVLCWSGNYEIRVATDNNQVHRIFAGIDPQSSEYTLQPEEKFVTPKLALTYSQEGLSGASRNFHRWARNGMIHNGKAVRDILLNSWEGVYMNITEEGMHQMMKDIAELGGELFVMDDGWFGDKYQRSQDNCALGDWSVDTRKLPNGLNGLIKEAENNHIKFGIWIEPESTNTKSELYEKHPDWVLQAKNRPLSLGRGGTQLLLDACNPEVQDFMFNMIDNLLTKHPGIAYIKWDANASLQNYGSTYLPKDRQSHIYIEYHRGLNKVLERVRAKYPDIVIQACGGGGGRVNYGVMPYFDEFWVSDDTDALQRIFMQWGTSYFYPSNAMAQHISASPNHQTGRSLPIKFRCDVAMSGRLGMELQPKNMTKEEKEQSQLAIKEYKEIRPTVQLGNLYRLISPYDHKGIASLMYTNDTKDKAVLFAYKMEHLLNQVVPRVRLAGLDPGKNYRVREINVKVGDKPCFLNGKLFSGTLLMNTGIELPMGREYASCILELSAE